MNTTIEQPLETDESSWEGRRFRLLRYPNMPPTAKLVALTLMDSERDDGYIVNITHQMIADFLGLHQPHISRSLMELRNMGIINWFIPENKERFDSYGNRNIYYFTGEFAPTALMTK